MYGKEEWLKQTLDLCVHYSEMGEAEKNEQFSKLEKAYQEFSTDEQESIHCFLGGLDNQAFLYVHSILVKYFGVQEFGENVIERMIQTAPNWYQGSMMELQVIRNIKDCYEKKRLLHKKNMDMYHAALGGMDYVPLPLEKRDKKKIVILTEQILSILHAPTKVVLDFAYVLQERLGYEILIFICPCDGSLGEGWWEDWFRMAASDDFQKLPMLVEYKGAILRGYQVNMSVANLKEYHMMMELIYAWKPWFVFQMGLTNPIGDLTAQFTTVAAMGMSIACPVSEGQILVRLGRQDEETEAEYARIAGKNGQTQIFMEERMPVLAEKSENPYTREKLGLPEDKFLIAIVGNRLDTEIDLEFSQVMKHILSDNETAVFAVIGEVKKAKEYFWQESYEKRIFYLGYCRDLMGVYSVMDLYANPRRGGGGFSSQMALTAGVPVVTLPDCDVAYHVGKEFTVENYPAMERVVCSCINDASYHEEMKRAAGIRGSANTDDKMEGYVRGMLDKIKEAYVKAL